MRRCLACQGERRLERVGYGVTGGEKRGGVATRCCAVPMGTGSPGPCPLTRRRRGKTWSGGASTPWGRPWASPPASSARGRSWPRS